LALYQMLPRPAARLARELRVTRTLFTGSQHSQLRCAMSPSPRLCQPPANAAANARRHAVYAYRCSPLLPATVLPARCYVGHGHRQRQPQAFGVCRSPAASLPRAAAPAASLRCAARRVMRAARIRWRYALVATPRRMRWRKQQRCETKCRHHYRARSEAVKRAWPRQYGAGGGDAPAATALRQRVQADGIRALRSVTPCCRQPRAQVTATALRQRRLPLPRRVASAVIPACSPLAACRHATRSSRVPRYAAPSLPCRPCYANATQSAATPA